MLALSLISLCVFIFSAYAYGATTLLALRRVPVWGKYWSTGPEHRAAIDPVVLALCLVCTAWFVLHSVSEFRLLTGSPPLEGVPDFIEFVLSFSFPPLIMHNMLHERSACIREQHKQRWMFPVWSMYALSLGTGAYLLTAALNVAPRPQPFGMWSGLSIGILFTLCSVYCIALMTLRLPQPVTPAAESIDERRLRRAMTALFFLMIPLFFALIFLRDRQLLTEALQRIARTLPIFFLVTSIYFENRFDFYDLIVKRAAMLLISLVVFGVFLTIVLGGLEQLPIGPARPWLFAVVMLPVAMVLPWLHRAVGRWLDRMWLGREFTPVEAVKQVLSAMQPATDEAALVKAAESRLSEMFHARVRILMGNEPTPPGALQETLTSPRSGASLRVAVLRDPGSRPLLSEDLSLLRSLVGVFGYMLENVWLQRRRQEQDQLAQELRLQTSRSELKALRAQINPHFLFNALNAIASLIHTDPTRADAAVEQLAEVFRYTLRRSEQEWAPLDQELAFAEAYLSVEHARFGRRLSYAVAATPEAATAQVPAMLLHTLVENAVKHGISQVRGTGRIEIQATAQGDMLQLEVSDTGPGPDSPAHARVAGESFGLRSIRDRLRGHFGDRAALDLLRDTARGVTIARMVIPLVREHAVALPQAQDAPEQSLRLSHHDQSVSRGR
jgi:signal transduction histidine kinase